MKDLLTQYHELFLADIHKRLFEENFSRLRKCLLELSEADIWYRPNIHSNSVGNLTLHLVGNMRQWVISGLLGNPDVRERDKEFEEQGPLPTPHLLDLLDQLEKELREGLAGITAEELVRVRPVQIYEENGITILVHVTEHFSYHVGQITYFVKARKDMDMGYYAGQDL
ncbi:MAG: DinB family protein [Bacteroidota bacterium]